MNFFKAMQYWISNLDQSWTDLWEIMSYAPAITIAVSMLIFIGGFKVLMINSAEASLRERVFKILISAYAVGCCWGIAFAVCTFFVSPLQIYHQAATGLHYPQPAAGRSLPANPANHYAKNMAENEIPLHGKRD